MTGREAPDTVTVRLAYGEDGLDVELPAERTTVVEPTYVAAAEDQAGLLRDALRHPVEGPPLRELVRPGQTVAISMCDGTRPQPRHLMIPAVLDELEGIVRARRRRGARRDRHAPREHRGGDPGDARRRGRRRGPGGQPRRPRRRVPGVARPARSRRTRVPQPALGRGRRADHDRVRRAALLRRVQRRPQARRPRSRGAGDGAHAARREADRGPAGHVGGVRGQPGARRHPGGGRGRRPGRLRARRGAQPRAADRRGVRRPDPRHARRGPGLVAAAGDAARARAVRRGGHHQRGLPARPEPLPGREGHVGRR